LAKATRFARKANAIVVVKLDRPALSVLDLHTIARDLQGKGVDLIVTEQSTDTSTPTGCLNMRGATAEFAPAPRRDRQLEVVAKAESDGRCKGHVRSTVYRVAADSP
jgi:DNA invertase Pin-like site-specific DNA recombinase